MKKIFLIIFTLLICVVLLPKQNVSSKTLRDLKQELSDFEAKYESNKNDRNKTQEEINTINRTIDGINAEIDSISDEMVKLKEEIAKLKEDIKSKKLEIDDIMNFLQVSSSESMYLEYVFGAKDFTDFIYRASIAEQLSKYNDDLINEYNKMIIDNNKKSDDLDLKKVQLSSKQNDLRVQVEKLGNDLSKFDNLAMSMDDQIKAKKSEIRIYESLGCSLDADITSCLGSGVSDTGFYRPVKTGQVTSNFGSRVPECYSYNMSCYHYGLDLSTSGSNYNDVPVYAAAAGIVVYIRDGYSAQTCGGKLVYISHVINGKAYTTGYMHLRKVNVSLNQVVTSNTIIGIMGGYPGKEWYDTCSTGAHLHFEVSTGNFSSGTYYSNRFNPKEVISFPAEYGWF